MVAFVGNFRKIRGNRLVRLHLPLNSAWIASPWSRVIQRLGIQVSTKSRSSCTLTRQVPTLEGAFAQRRAVTRRTSRTVNPGSLLRKHDVSKLGQSCCEQFRTSSRSALAKATVPLASTRGAKPGRTTTTAPSKQKIARAISDLIIRGC